MKFPIILAGLSLAAVLRAAPPVVFQALDPVRPDETFLLFGADLTPAVTAEGVRVPDKPVMAPPGSVVRSPVGPNLKPETLAILQATDLSAKVLIPATWTPGIFAVRLRNADGTGDWQFANRPQLWWQMSDLGGKATPGGELRVFGKNFGKSSRLWLVDGKAAARELPLKIARDFDVTAVLPRDLAIGTYRVWLHNGKGGTAGFGEPLPLEVVTADVWPETVFDVTQFGANSDDEHDDTDGIRRALKAAEANNGGIVYLPRGTYIVTGKLVIPARTILRGESKDGVLIKVPLYWPHAPQKLAELDAVIAGNGHFGVENLTLVATPAQRLIVAPDSRDSYGPGMSRWHSYAPVADDVHLRNLRLQHLYFSHRLNAGDSRRKISESPSTVVIYGADFSLEDSEVISPGMPIQINGAVRARICRNVLRTGRNGGYGLYESAGRVCSKTTISRPPTWRELMAGCRGAHPN